MYLFGWKGGCLFHRRTDCPPSPDCTDATAGRLRPAMWKAPLLLVFAVLAGLTAGACGSGSLDTAFGGTWTGTLKNVYTDDDGGFSGAGFGTNEQLIVTVAGNSAQLSGVCGDVTLTGGSVVMTGSGNAATLPSETVACQFAGFCPGPSLGDGPGPDAGTGAVTYSSGMVTLSNAAPPQLTMALTGRFMIPCSDTIGYPEVNVTTTFMGAQSP